MKQKKQWCGFLSILLGILGVSLLVSLLTGKGEKAKILRGGLK